MQKMGNSKRFTLNGYGLWRLVVKQQVQRSNNTFFAFILGIMCLGMNGMAQTPYILKGIVMDESDNLLANVKVTLEPHGISTVCDLNGNFTLEVNPEHPANDSASFTLNARDVGYQNALIDISSQQLSAGMDGIILKLVTNPVSGDVIGFSVEMGGEVAEFYVYVPAAVDRVRAAFYVSHHGIGDITREDMHQFAAEEEIALIGFFGSPVQRGFEPVSIVDEYIDSLAILSGHPELSHVPIMTFGHSNGTGFATSYPRDRPEQCISWLSYHPGFTAYLQYQNTETIPSMVMVGTADSYFNPAYDETGRRGSRQDLTVYGQRESYDAPMNVMVEGGVGHAPNDKDATWAFIYEFLRASMRIRLADDGTLNNINIQSGWLGAHYDLDLGGRQMLDIDSYEDYTGDKSEANWFPDKTFARHWQCYGATARLCAPLVTGISLNPKKDTICIGETLQLIPTISPTNALNQALNYSSSDTSVARVSADGLITAIKSGQTTVTVTTISGGYTERCELLVLDSSLVSDYPETDRSIFELFPNPAHHFIALDVPDKQKGSYAIFNSIGQSVLLGDVSQGFARIDISELLSGVYLMRVKAGSKFYAKKIIKI